MDKDKRLMEASWWERLTEGETESCSDGQVHAQEIFNPIFCWWVGLCSLPVVSWGQTLVEVMKIMVTFKRSHACTAPLSASHWVQQATADPWLCWRHRDLTAKSGSVSLGVTAPFSWVLVCIRLCALQESDSLALCKFWQLCSGVNGNLLDKVYWEVNIYQFCCNCCAYNIDFSPPYTPNEVGAIIINWEKESTSSWPLSG